MKHKHACMIAVALALCVFLSAGAAAALDAPEIRVNGSLVTFTDVQPYTDLRGRVMVPVRFVAESLWAEVTWNGESRTVRISKDGAVMEIPIGSRTVSVSWLGKTATLEMDAEAVLKNDRTMIPIRYVAEALGTYVDHASRYNTVGIWLETLNSQEIARLQALPYTQPDYAVSYEEAKECFTLEDLLAFYGEDRDSFTEFANAREYLYRGIDRCGTYYFPALDMQVEIDSPEELLPLVAAEAAAELALDSPHLRVSFRTDESCLYQADTMSGLTTAVRGIATVQFLDKPTSLAVEEAALLCSLGIHQITEGETLHVDLDVHMNTQPDYRVDIHTLIPLGAAY